MKFETCDCVVVGGGPAGLVFSYLAARAGLRVVLLEAAKDFNRRFRGDTLNPLALTLLKEMGLADEVLALPHSKVDTLRAAAGEDALTLSYARLRTPYPFVAVLSQPLFLGFLAQKAAQYPGFELRLRANVSGLLEENGAVHGVTYKDAAGNIRELRAPLTVGADGRSSAVRDLAGVETVNLTREPDEVVWFNLPRQTGDPEEGLVARESVQSGVFMFQRPDEWQIGVTLKTGGYRERREEGVQPFRRELRALLPEFGARLDTLEWRDTALLKVELKRAKRWHREGLLLIGDAAHVMSPLGGVGINLALRDAVVAANSLLEPLKRGKLQTKHLAQVQRAVGWEVRLTQEIQALAQKGARRARKEGELLGVPAWVRATLLRVPALRDLARAVLGVWPHTRLPQ